MKQLCRISYIDIKNSFNSSTERVFNFHVGSKESNVLRDNRWDIDCQYHGGPPGITKWCGPAFDPMEQPATNSYMGWSF